MLVHFRILLTTYSSLKTNLVYIGVGPENQLKLFFRVLILTLKMLGFLKVLFSGGQFEPPLFISTMN